MASSGPRVVRRMINFDHWTLPVVGSANSPLLRLFDADHYFLPREQRFWQGYSCPQECHCPSKFWKLDVGSKPCALAEQGWCWIEKYEHPYVTVPPPMLSPFGFWKKVTKVPKHSRSSKFTFPQVQSLRNETMFDSSLLCILEQLNTFSEVTVVRWGCDKVHIAQLIWPATVFPASAHAAFDYHISI